MLVAILIPLLAGELAGPKGGTGWTRIVDCGQKYGILIGHTGNPGKHS
tara:strand:- start:557 stop:700 length:144 start_codon:yes stop_codon:yes gene_type:complete